jgi:hypothetical protein
MISLCHEEDAAATFIHFVHRFLSLRLSAETEAVKDASQYAQGHTGSDALLEQISDRFSMLTFHAWEVKI